MNECSTEWIQILVKILIQAVVPVIAMVTALLLAKMARDAFNYQESFKAKLAKDIEFSKRKRAILEKVGTNMDVFQNLFMIIYGTTACICMFPEKDNQYADKLIKLRDQHEEKMQLLKIIEGQLVDSIC